MGRRIIINITAVVLLIVLTFSMNGSEVITAANAEEINNVENQIDPQYGITLDKNLSNNNILQETNENDVAFTDIKIDIISENISEEVLSVYNEHKELLIKAYNEINVEASNLTKEEMEDKTQEIFNRNKIYRADTLTVEQAMEIFYDNREKFDVDEETFLNEIKESNPNSVLLQYRRPITNPEPVIIRVKTESVETSHEPGPVTKEQLEQVLDRRKELRIERYNEGTYPSDMTYEELVKKIDEDNARVLSEFNAGNSVVYSKEEYKEKFRLEKEQMQGISTKRKPVSSLPEEERIKVEEWIRKKAEEMGWKFADKE